MSSSTAEFFLRMRLQAQCLACSALSFITCWSSFLNFMRSIASEDVLEIGSSSFMIVFCWLYVTLFGVALGGFVTFHTYLLVQNFTTIELVEKKGSPARGK